MSNPYGCDSCGDTHCPMRGKTAGCKGWVRADSATVLHTIQLPPAPRSMVLSADIGTACNQILEAIGDDANRLSDAVQKEVDRVLADGCAAETARIYLSVDPGHTDPASVTICAQRGDSTRVVSAEYDDALAALAAQLASQAEAKRVERSDKVRTAIANATVPCSNDWSGSDWSGCKGVMVRIEGTMRLACNRCGASELGLTAESRGRGTATRVSASSLPTHWERAAPSPCNPTLYDHFKEMFTRQRESSAAMTRRTIEQACGIQGNIVLRPDVDPLDVEYDGHALRDLIERDRIARHTDQPKAFTPAQRAAVSAHWSAQLRAKVDAAKQAERNVVTYCDLDSDD